MVVLCSQAKPRPSVNMKCKWGLTGFYLTKELCFDLTINLMGFKSLTFNVYQHIIAWGIY